MASLRIQRPSNPFKPCCDTDLERCPVKNLWTKKNPLLSLWLSGANAVAGSARGQATAAVKRQQTTLARQASRFWTDSWLAAVTPKRRR